MFYEATYKYTAPDDKGRDKQHSERILIENPAGFAEAEEVAYKYATENVPEECEVVGLSRKRIMEVVNNEPSDMAWKVYYVSLEATTIGDDDKEKKIRYVVALYAHNIDEAHTIAREYRKQGFGDMTIVTVAETKLKAIIKA